MQASSASIGCAFWVLTKKTYGYNWYDWRRWKGLGISYRNLKKFLYDKIICQKRKICNKKLLSYG